MEREDFLRSETAFSKNGILSGTGMLAANGGFISLGSILQTYNAPISEDHAWALCYSVVRSLEEKESSDPGYFCSEQTLDTDLINVDSEGQLRLDVTPVKNGEEQIIEENALLMSTSELIAKLAMIIYKALDFALKEDEERSLGPDLANLLEKMISADDNNNSLTFQDVADACEEYFKKNAPTHRTGCIDLSKNICRDLVNDALEFAKFVGVADYASRAIESMNLEMERNGPRHSPRFQGTPHIFEKSRGENFKAVAHLWIRVVREFREGAIHLKVKSDSKAVIRKEYNKTPYELLLDDIKTRKYHLRKVSEENVARSRAGPPTSHDIVMEYIRSKPKLRNVTERLMNRPVKLMNMNPFDELMESIRQAQSVPHLKPVPMTKKSA